MDNKHDQNKAWGELSGYAQEYRSPSETTASTVPETLVSLDDRRDIAMRAEIKLVRPAINAAAWAIIVKWICITALLVTAIKTVGTIVTNIVDNLTVEYVTQSVGPGVVPPAHDPRNGNHSL